MSTYLQENALQGKDLVDLAHTLNSRRSMFPWRSFAIGRSIAELQDFLDDCSRQATRIINQPLRIAMVFTGQGAQWPRMGHELIEAFPVFRDSLEQCEQHLRSFGATWSLLGKRDCQSLTTLCPS